MDDALTAMTTIAHLPPDTPVTIRRRVAPQPNKDVTFVWPTTVHAACVLVRGFLWKGFISLQVADPDNLSLVGEECPMCGEYLHRPSRLNRF